jgi:Uma2 family endonuclease
MPTEYRIRPITADDYHRMAGVGIFEPDERVELLDGELIAMPPVGIKHAFAVRRLNAIFQRRFADRAIVDSQSPLALDVYSEPQPDVMLLGPRDDWYGTALPEPADVLLVVEVSESTLRYDRGPKLRAYARAGIAELWIVDLVEGRIERFCEPAGETYARRQLFARGTALAPTAFPADPIEVEALLP